MCPLHIHNLNTPYGCKRDGHPVLGSRIAFPRIRRWRIAKAWGRREYTTAAATAAAADAIAVVQKRTAAAAVAAAASSVRPRACLFLWELRTRCRHKCLANGAITGLGRAQMVEQVLKELDMSRHAPHGGSRMWARRINHITPPCGYKRDGHPVMGCSIAFPRVRRWCSPRARGRIICAVVVFDILSISLMI